jgi:PAS domain S-box-containing protein
MSDFSRKPPPRDEAGRLAAQALERQLRGLGDAPSRGELLFREIYEHAWHLAGLLDPEGRLLHANAVACGMIGRDPAELCGLPFWETPWWTHSEAEQRKLRAAIERASSGDFVQFETTHTTAAGEERQLLFWIRPVLDSEGRVFCLIPESIDITEERRVERSYREIFNATSDALLILDREGRILDRNEPAAELFGAVLAPGTQPRLCELLEADGMGGPSPEVGLALAFEGRAGALPAREWRLRQAGGSHRQVEASLRAGEIGGQTRVIASIRDIEQRKRAEAEREHLGEQLQQALKLEAVGRLAGGVAHDFNNLLAAITGNIELAQRQLGDASPKALEEARLASAEAAALTRQLLAFSRRQRVEPRRVDLSELVDAVLPMLPRLLGGQIELLLQLDPRAGAVRIDPGQFSQALVNLVVNAREAMPGGGSLRLVSAPLEDGDPRPAALGLPPRPHWTSLALIDSGHGMSAAVRERIFEPFFSTKPQDRGTGLGLAMAFGAIQQAGGGIEVVSAPGEGAAFTILLPREEE